MFIVYILLNIHPLMLVHFDKLTHRHVFRWKTKKIHKNIFKKDV